MLQLWAYVYLTLPVDPCAMFLEILPSYCSINGNSHKLSLWVVAHLLHDPELLERVRKETKAGIVEGSPNASYLVKNCPQLEAVYLEVLRLTMASSLMRQIKEPTALGGKTLSKGHSILIPYRLLHFNTDVWGQDASQIDPERFLKKTKDCRATQVSDPLVAESTSVPVASWRRNLYSPLLLFCWIASTFH